MLAVRLALACFASRCCRCLREAPESPVFPTTSVLALSRHRQTVYLLRARIDVPVPKTTASPRRSFWVPAHPYARNRHAVWRCQDRATLHVPDSPVFGNYRRSHKKNHPRIQSALDRPPCAAVLDVCACVRPRACPCRAALCYVAIGVPCLLLLHARIRLGLCITASMCSILVLAY